MDSIRDESFLHPTAAEIKQNLIPKQAHLHPTVVIPAGNSRAEPKERGGQDKDSLVPLVHKAQVSAAPSFGTAPCRARSWAGSLWSFPTGDIPGLPPGLLSPCSPSRNCCSGLAQSTSWAQPGSPALGRSLSCHSGQRDEAGLGLPFLIHQGYPHVRPLLTELC